MNFSYIRIILQGVVLMALQLLLFRNIAFFNVAFCFLYVAILLYVPLETSRILTMFLAFAIGMIADIFYNTLGIHASAMVLTAFLRYYWVNMITPQGGYEPNASPSIGNMGMEWFSTYALPLLFIHHFALFFTEAGGFSSFWPTLLKVFFSTIFSFLVIVILEILFSGNKRNA